MEHRKIRAFVMGMALCGLAVQTASAETCYWINTPDQGDSFYMSGWGCAQTYIDDMWSRYDFDIGNWDSGFGYEAPCDNARPLARTFNALQLMAYSHTSTPTCSTSGSNVTDWAYCWAGNSIDELDGACGSGSMTGTRAKTAFTPGLDNYTDLYWPFFYGETVAQRAGTIFHEARHAQGWCAHSCSCPRGSSCDPNFNNGCVGPGSSSGKGANAFQVIFLNWFALTATWTTTAMQSSAVTEGNSILGSGFCSDPCFRLDSSGNTYQTC